MRAHYVLTCVLVALAISSCEDNPALIEADDKFRPDNIINAKMFITGEDTVTAQNIESDVVEFSAFNYLMLGQHKDTKHGSIKADFTSELSTGVDIGRALHDIDTINNIKVKAVEFDSCEFRIRYKLNSWLGDTISMQEVSIYELNSILDRDTKYNSDFNPEGMYDPNKPIGQLEYRVKHADVDTLWNISDYTHNLIVPIEDEVGMKIFNADYETISNADNFRELFNGVYVTTEQLDQKEGALLQLNYRSSLQELVIYYEATLDTFDYLGINDSIVPLYKTFPINKEVAKAISYQRNFDDSEIDFDDTNTDKIYLQGMNGAMANVNISQEFIDYWYDILPDPNVENDDLITSIASVELSFFEDIDTMVTDYLRKIPANLSLYIKDDNGEYITPRFDRSASEIGVAAFSIGEARLVDDLRVKYTFSFTTGFFEELIRPTLEINKDRYDSKDFYLGITNPNFSLSQAVLNGFDKKESNITVRYVEVN